MWRRPPARNRSERYTRPPRPSYSTTWPVAGRGITDSLWPGGPISAAVLDLGGDAGERPAALRAVGRQVPRGSCRGRSYRHQPERVELPRARRRLHMLAVEDQHALPRRDPARSRQARPTLIRRRGPPPPGRLTTAAAPYAAPRAANSTKPVAPMSRDVRILRRFGIRLMSVGVCETRIGRTGRSDIRSDILPVMLKLLLAALVLVLALTVGSLPTFATRATAGRRWTTWPLRGRTYSRGTGSCSPVSTIKKPAKRQSNLLSRRSRTNVRVSSPMRLKVAHATTLEPRSWKRCRLR